jgi:hypothetical protein
MSKKKTKKRKVDIDLDAETYDFLREVSELSKVSMDDLVSAILATYLVREKRKDERQKKI